MVQHSSTRLQRIFNLFISCIIGQDSHGITQRLYKNASSFPVFKAAAITTEEAWASSKHQYEVNSNSGINMEYVINSDFILWENSVSSNRETLWICLLHTLLYLPEKVK